MTIDLDAPDALNALLERAGALPEADHGIIAIHGTQHCSITLRFQPAQ
jgi:hypothetical protein